MLILGIVSAGSVSLILAGKWYRNSGTLSYATLTVLLVWSVALPLCVRQPLHASTFDPRQAVVAGIAIVGAALANVALARRLGWDLTRARRLMAVATEAPWRTLALMVIVAPVCEEYIFRGFVLQLFLPWGIIAALAISTLVFVVAHTDWASVPHLLVAGFLFGGLALASGGLAAPIAAHMVANALGFVALQRLRLA